MPVEMLLIVLLGVFLLLMRPKTMSFSAPLDGPDAREPGACRSMPARLGSASLD
jgi:hypothetical protein